MNRLITVGFALAAAFATRPALADTLTWTGGSSGAFSADANWSNSSGNSRTTPQAGDTVTFNSSVTLTAESFALDSGTLTFDVASGMSVTSSVPFSGTGALVKTGAGTLELKVASTYSGGTTISDGQLKLWDKTAVGTGTVTIQRADGCKPNLWLTFGNNVFDNAIAITGPFSATQDGDYDIADDNQGILSGSLTCEGSLKIRNVWGWNGRYGKGVPILCLVTVTGGGTLYAKGSLWLESEQNASVCQLSGNLFLTNGYVNANADAVITNAATGVIQFYEGSHFAGREVVAKGAAVTNVLGGASCFGDETVVKLLGGATLQVASFARVPRLFVDEAEVPAGVYTAANFPGSFAGNGVLYVGAATSVSTWKGGSSGTWTGAANWDNGVPLDGQVAVFNSAVRVGGATDADTVTIGEGGLSVVCNADVTVSTNVTFTGVGKLTKAGAKMLTFDNMFALNTYSGGTEILNGHVNLSGISDNATSTYIGASLGTGPVTLRRAAGRECAIRMETQVVLSNAVSVLGPYTANADNGTFYTFRLNNGAKITGTITAEDDIKVVNAWSRGRIADVNAHGHTVYCNPDSKNTPIEFTGAVDASFEKGNAGGGLIYTTGSFTDPNASYTLLGGTNYVDAAATIACRDVVVSNAANGVSLQLNGEGNLSRKAKLSLWNGGKLDVKSGVRARVAELWVDGVKQPDGTYRASAVPAGATVTGASFTGAGTLRVGDLGAFLIIR